MNRPDVPAARRAFLRPTPSIWGALASLRVRDEERHLIAPNAPRLERAERTAEALTYGMHRDDRPFGLVFLIDPRLPAIGEEAGHVQADCLYVWRLMIDREHRGRGHGRAAIDFAKAYAQLIGLGGVSLTTKDRAPLNALPLYLGEGFEPTGRRLDDEIELAWRDAS